jgi:hypothetical protein
MPRNAVPGCGADAKWDFGPETAEENAARVALLTTPEDPRATFEAQLIGSSFESLKACVAQILSATAPDWTPRAMEHMDDFWRNVDNPDLDASVDAALGYAGGVGGASYVTATGKPGRVFDSVGEGLIWALHAVNSRQNPDARYRMYGRLLEATWFTIEEKQAEGFCIG